MDKRLILFGGFIVLLIVFVLLHEGVPEVDGSLVGEDVPEVDGSLVGEGVFDYVDYNYDYVDYNYDYVDEEVKGILNGMIKDKKTAFYLPPTGFVNVSGGSEFGVAYALNNVDPRGENYFVFNWSVGSEDCGVGDDVAFSWIERGWTSWGKIGEGWVDHLTVYFSFPDDVENCSVSYDFVLEKDGEMYDTKQIEFRIV